MNFHLSSPMANAVPLMAMGFMICTAIVHIGFAMAVFRDATQLSRQQTGPLIVGPQLWSLATLVGGVYVAAIYWAVNHSMLSRRL